MPNTCIHLRNHFDAHSVFGLEWIVKLFQFATGAVRSRSTSIPNVVYNIKLHLYLVSDIFVSSPLRAFTMFDAKYYLLLTSESPVSCGCKVSSRNITCMYCIYKHSVRHPLIYSVNDRKSTRIESANNFI